MAFVLAIIALIVGIGAWLSGVAAVLTFIGGFAVWLTTFLSNPLFENADTLVGDLFTLTGWSILSWVICVVLTFVLGGLAGGSAVSSVHDRF